MRGAPRYTNLLAVPGVRYVAAVLGVAAMTILLRLLPGASQVTNISLLYLLVVTVVAVLLGSGPAVLASVLAVLAFDWFFVEPRHTFRVNDPAEWISLFTFLFTAAVTGQLTALLRSQAAQARRREEETAALAEASWAVAAQLDRDRALAEVLRRLLGVAPVRASAILVEDSTGDLTCAASIPPGADFHRLRPAERQAARRVLESGCPVNWVTGAGSPDPPSPSAAHEAAFLPLTVENRTLGALCFHPLPGRVLSPQEARIVQTLASHAAIVLERDRLAGAEADARALGEADRLKTALLSMVSHDFRSPLTSIKATVTGLLQEGASWDPATQRDLLRGIDRETDRLNGMVGNILALSRLEADAWRPRREPTPVAELVGAALPSFAPSDDHRIQLRLDPSLPEVDLDPVQMVQVLRNLVDNALKYSAPASLVELVARREDGRLVLEVQDRGMGLPAGEEERIFEPFYRAPGLQESSVPGVGIGLAVCRGLVEAHHGELTAGARPGGGSVFRISLPITANDESPRCR
jgi:two-component system, OmpR family, sensor histidine kinase KdpD